MKRTQAGNNVKQTCCEWQGTLSQYLEQHSRGQCLIKIVPCPFACNAKLPQGELEHHKKSDCINRIVTCRLCDEEFPESLRFYHEDLKCLEKETKCAYCGQKLIRKELGEMPFGNSPLFIPNDVMDFDCYSGHYRTCPKVNVYCDFSDHGCKTIVLREGLSEHYSSCAQKHEVLVEKAFRMGTYEALKCWPQGCIIWKIPVSDIQKANLSTCHFIQESEYVRVGNYRSFLRLIVKDGTVYVFVCVGEVTNSPCIAHLSINVGAAYCPDYSTQYGVYMRKDGGNRISWSFGDALRYNPYPPSFGKEDSVVTPMQLFKWSLDGHCTIRANFHLSSQEDTVVGSRQDQSSFFSNEAVEDFFLKASSDDVLSSGSGEE
jgi:hypothetical protein